MIAMEKSGKPGVILIGLPKEEIDLLSRFLGTKYNFIAINHDFPLDRLKSYENIRLFAVNTDLVWADIMSIARKIKGNTRYHNIPFLGLALKRHLKKCKHKERDFFEDLILMPCNKEDFLTRVDVWAETSRTLNGCSIQGS